MLIVDSARPDTRQTAFGDRRRFSINPRKISENCRVHFSRTPPPRLAEATPIRGHVRRSCSPHVWPGGVVRSRLLSTARAGLNRPRVPRPGRCLRSRLDPKGAHGYHWRHCRCRRRAGSPARACPIRPAFRQTIISVVPAGMRGGRERFEYPVVEILGLEIAGEFNQAADLLWAQKAGSCSQAGNFRFSWIPSSVVKCGRC